MSSAYHPGDWLISPRYRVLRARRRAVRRVPGERLFDALNRLSYCDTTTYTDGAAQSRKAIDHAG